MIAVYKITCNPTGKLYIGKDVNYPDRFNEHKSSLRRGVHYNTYLQAAWNKYGESSFSFDIVQEASDKDTVCLLEYYWMEYFESFRRDKGYNLVVGIGSSGMTKSEETRRKISESHKGKKVPREVVEKVTEKLCKKVFQYTLEDEFIAEYPSVKECAIMNKWKACNVGFACRDSWRTAYGYKFSYTHKLIESGEFK